MIEAEIRPEELLGIAKKVSLEWDKLPLHTHGALIQLVNVVFEHRKLTLQRAEKQAQDDQRERMLAMQEKQTLLAEEHNKRERAMQDRNLAEDMLRQGAAPNKNLNVVDITAAKAVI